MAFPFYMDTLRVQSDFLKGVIGNWISGRIKKAGYGASFTLNSIEITEMGDGSYKAHLNSDLKIPKEDITQFLHLSL